MWVQLSFVTGNLMAAFVIPVTSELFLYYLFTGLCAFVCFLFGFLREPLPHPVDEKAIEEDKGENLNLEVPGKNGDERKLLNATTSVSPFDAEMIENEVQTNADVSEIKATWNLLWTKRMFKLVPLLLWTAIS
jgi:hypothetical protein